MKPRTHGAGPRIQKILEIIENCGWVLVYPIKNQNTWPSLWHGLYPRSTMHWAWDAEADPRVASLWLDRERVAADQLAVYSKWFRNRATFFSKSYFVRLLAEQRPFKNRPKSATAKWILRELLDNSPQSTKALKKLYRREHGSLLERDWDRALKELFGGLWIVGLGEEDDGAFPSLKLAATELVWDELWRSAIESASDCD